MEPTPLRARPSRGASGLVRPRARQPLHLPLRDPSRGDIVVFNTPDRAVARCGAGGTFVKRLVGLPGDRISMSEGVLHVDGEPLEEPYVNGGDHGNDFPVRKLGADEYFMMGDNRGSSCDSREWGPVARDDLIGPVFAVYWPLTRLGLR
jgi:signal peptidase I